MDEIKVFKMGFGESILLSNDDECLLVDCGSESIRRNEYFKNVKLELEKYTKRSAMISHFHEDHINGFMEIIREKRHMFDTVYIPHVFTMQHPNITDLELARHLLMQRHFPYHSSITLWDFLKLLCRQNQNIRLLHRAEAAFSCVGDEFDVLWPQPKELISAQLGKSLFSGIDIDFLESIYEISDKINNTFIMLAEYRGDYPQNNIEEIFDNIKALTERFVQLPISSEAKEQQLRLIKSIRVNSNKTSIVCHNNSEKSILLTGDIPSATMRRIANGSIPGRVYLKHYYDTIKIPHHGTATHYFNFGVYSDFKRIIISNGQSRIKRRGRIFGDYDLISRGYDIICTNTSYGRCDRRCTSPRHALYDTCGCDRKDKYIVI